MLLEEAAPPAMIYLLVDDLEHRLADLRAAGVDVVAEPHDIFTDTDKVFGGSWRIETRPSSATPRAIWSDWSRTALTGDRQDRTRTAQWTVATR